MSTDGVVSVESERGIASEPSSRAAAGVLGRYHKWVVLALVAVGTFMTALDASIVNIGLPSIARAFRAPVGGAVEWVIIIYLVVIAGTLLTFGRLSDIVGRKPVWLTGFALFVLGSALCGAATSLGMLVIARAFQGLGGALIFAPGLAIIADAFPPTERGRALGMNAVVFAIGTSFGPTLGGLITEHLSWRWIFYINLPFGVLGLIASSHVLARSEARTREPLDLPGAVLIAIGFSLLTVALSFGNAWGWVSARLLTCLAIAIVALVTAARVEQRARHPIVDLALFRQPVLASSLGSMMLSMLALFAVSFMLPFYFEELRGFSVATAGFLLTPLPLTIAVVAPFSGALADRLGSRWLASGGLALASMGLLLLSRLDANTTIAQIVGGLVLTGLGQGMFQSPNSRALMNAAPAGQQGEASGLLASARVVGQSLSVALAAAIFTAMGGASAGLTLAAARAAAVSPADVLAVQHTFLAAFSSALLACAGLGAIGILAAFVRGQDRKDR
jgi:EmrB/QacA subfamily drug resistance transporter